jgi:hypothetical protein
MARIDNGIVRQYHKFVPDAVHYLFVAATRKIRPANAMVE